MMRWTLLLTGALMLLLCGACIAAGTEESDENCPCLLGSQSETGIPGILLETTSSEQIEWVCETYRYVVCTDYDTEPCAWCVVPCGAVCGWCAAFTDPRAILACYTTCIAACAAGCPECEYCSHYELEEEVVCGWVLVE